MVITEPAVPGTEVLGTNYIYIIYVSILLHSCSVFLAEYTEIEQAKERFYWHGVPGAGGEFRKLVNREEILL